MKKMMLAAVLLTGMLTTGCHSADRLHDTSYLRAVSIEGTDEKTLTFTFFAGEDSVIVAKGNDMDSAKEAAELRSGRRIFTGYTEIAVLGSGAGTDALEFLLNDWKVPPSCLAVYSSDSDLLKKTDAEELAGSVRRGIEQDMVPECDIVTVLGKLCRDGRAETAEVSEKGTVGTAVISSGDGQRRIHRQGDSKGRRS